MKKFAASYPFNHLHLEDQHPRPRIIQEQIGYYADDDFHSPRYWYAGVGFLTGSRAALLLPVEGLDQMSDADLVSAIRGITQAAKLAQTEFRLLTTDRDILIDSYSESTVNEFRRDYGHIYFHINCFYRSSQIVQEFWDWLRPYWEGSNPEAGYVYILDDQNGHYKIGRSKSLTSRIKQLSTQPPFTIKLVAAFRAVNDVVMEKSLHHQYAEKRLRGEWFQLSAEDLTRILEVNGFGGYLTEEDLQQFESGSRLLTDGDSAKQ